MIIQRARKLKVGDTVHCPEDRGTPAFYGKVTHVDVNAEASKTFLGTEYILVTIKHPHRHTSIWPSTRLS